MFRSGNAKVSHASGHSFEMAGASATTIAAMPSIRWAPLRMAEALGH